MQRESRPASRGGLKKKNLLYNPRICEDSRKRSNPTEAGHFSRARNPSNRAAPVSGMAHANERFFNAPVYLSATQQPPVSFCPPYSFRFHKNFPQYTNPVKIVAHRELQNSRSEKFLPYLPPPILAAKIGGGRILGIGRD